MEKKREIYSWEDLMCYIKKDVQYWAFYIKRRTPLELEDIKQDILLELWRLYNDCRNKKSRNHRKSLTAYFFQKRLFWMSTRIIKRHYSSNTYRLKNSKEYITTVNVEEIELMQSIDSSEERAREMEKLETVRGFFTELRNELNKIKDDKTITILDMMLSNVRNKEIAKELKMRQGTLSWYITRKIKRPIERKVLNYEERNKTSL